MKESTSVVDDNPDLERVVDRSTDMMNGILYTFKTHYKMAEAYEKASRVADLLVAGGTGTIAALLVWGSLSQQLIVIAALGVAFLSWIQATLKLGVKAERHYTTADRHHTLYEEFDDFVKLEVPSEEISATEKMERFEQLSRERQRLNELSPRTTNFWYNRLSDEDVGATAGSGKEEVETLSEIAPSD